MKSEDLAKELKKMWENIEVQQFNELNSTNSYVKDYLKNNKGNEIFVLANKQTSGRGRNNRSFFSALDHGLYFTIGFSVVDIEVENLSLYTIAAATAMIQSVEEELGLTLKVKWVNDLFYRGKKVAGILAEALTDQETNKISSLVLGIGLNIAGSFDTADEQIQKTAGTLYPTLPAGFKLEALIKSFLKNFYSYHQHIEDRAFIPLYEKHLLGIGQEVYYFRKNQKYTARIRGINEQGHLLVRNQGSQKDETLIADEIHFSSQQFVQNIGEANEKF